MSNFKARESSPEKSKEVNWSMKACLIRKDSLTLVRIVRSLDFEPPNCEDLANCLNNFTDLEAIARCLEPINSSKYVTSKSKTCCNTCKAKSTALTCFSVACLSLIFSTPVPTISNKHLATLSWNNKLKTRGAGLAWTKVVKSLVLTIVLRFTEAGKDIKINFGSNWPKQFFTILKIGSCKANCSSKYKSREWYKTSDNRNSKYGAMPALRS
ncbi:hypothetical protein WICPIJ_007570 [Wickerhamomyces pijperi]|uniref:Uncharacterized protein n=1 Tax=Wickerhamomyces pijperi TaxID=599730 RepID=A0A9P8PZY5_WICPI|nr:hypothetical protein WICPIJ_007570 [Wickerhamomyces pijperi]